MNKQTLRRMIREKKRGLSRTYIQSKSEELARLFLETPQYRQAVSLYGYCACNQEVLTFPILERALRDGKRVAVPKCFGNEMRFFWIDDLKGLVKNAWGVPEPVSDTCAAGDETALVLMPGLAFDPKGHRLGYGGGYYDRFLAKEPRHPTIALCYDFQMVDHLPTDDFDIPVDLVLRA